MTRRFSILAAFTLVLAAGAVLFGGQPRGGDLFGAAYAQETKAEDIDTSRVVNLELQPGEASIFAFRIAHASPPNTGCQGRVPRGSPGAFPGVRPGRREESCRAPWVKNSRGTSGRG